MDRFSHKVDLLVPKITLRNLQSDLVKAVTAKHDSIPQKIKIKIVNIEVAQIGPECSDNSCHFIV